MRAVAAGAALLLVACGSPTTEVAAVEKVKARRVLENAETFHDETQQAIIEAEEAVAEAERVIAEEVAKAAAEAARERAVAAAAARAARSATTQPRAATAPTGDDFWRRLANCESASGTGGNGGGYFQFSPDTARKVGYRAGMSYEEQKSLAIKWLGMIGGRGGSRSGWPVCWWKAGGK